MDNANSSSSSSLPGGRGAGEGGEVEDDQLAEGSVSTGSGIIPQLVDDITALTIRVKTHKTNNFVWLGSRRKLNISTTIVCIHIHICIYGYIIHFCPLHSCFDLALTFLLFFSFP